MISILWIEDEPDTVRGFREELEEYLRQRDVPFKMQRARTRDEARELMAGLGHDIVFLDPMLPDNPENGDAGVINRSAGTQLMEWCHEVLPKSRRAFRVVVFTGMVNPQRVKELQEHLTDEDVYVEKTATIEEFMNDISDLIQRALGAERG